MPKDVTKKEKKEKESKEKKHFFKDFKAELKRVIWPTPKQLINNTVAVITIVLITAIIVFVLDVIFESLNNYGVNKLKSIVDSHKEQSENTSNNQQVENAVNNILNGESNTETNSEKTNTENK